MITRRAFLRYTALGGAAATTACGGPGGGPAVDAAPVHDAACRATAADVLGPFYLPGAPSRMQLAAAAEPGERLAIAGTVLGADCTPLAGVLLDVWQADKDGAYHGGAVDQFRLRGTVMTDASGRFEVETIRPGNYQQAPGLWRPAHLHVTLSHPAHRSVSTQLYFAGDRYLPPNDSCGACGSDDPDRVIALAGSAAAGWSGTVTLALAAV